jgi:S1-C subfamily serine protease
VAGDYENVLSGVHIQEMTPDIKQGLEIPDKTSGVIVTNIEEDTPAAELLKKGDVIQEINRKSIDNLEAYTEVVSKISKKESVLLLVFRSGGYIYVTLSP